jgi:ATP-dependent helicase HrpB
MSSEWRDLSAARRRQELAPIALLDADRARGGTLLMRSRVAPRVPPRLGWRRCSRTAGSNGRFPDDSTERRANTRLEVITEGIRRAGSRRPRRSKDRGNLRRISERSLQADLGLALCLDAQEHLRESCACS